MSLEECGYSELDASEGIKGSLSLHKFDPNVEEIWLMQCAKSLNVKRLESQKIKLPGRTVLNDLECISLENADEEEHNETFGFSSRKGKMSVCRLPIKGTILVRERISAPQRVGIEELEERCPIAIIAAPHDKTRLRHPLLGHQFQKALDIHPKIRHRLTKLSKLSQNSSIEVAKRKPILEVNRSKTLSRSSNSELHEGDVDDSISANFGKRRKKTKADARIKTKISDDLQWIKNI